MEEGKTTYISKEGLAKLQEELLQLKNVRRREIADRIQQAKELGDLSENAEYAEAKNEQAFIEGRLLEIESLIRNAVVIDDQHKKGGGISVGSSVELLHNGKTVTYMIVGTSEADPGKGRISNESPIGKNLLGKKIGESISVTSPSGANDYTVQGIH